MARYLVSKTVYLSTVVEADSEDSALEIANDKDFADWDWNDEDSPNLFLYEEEQA